MTKGRGYGFLLLSALVYAINVVDRQLLPLMAEAVRKDIALADWQIGLLTGLAFAVCYALCTLPLAWVADGGNRRNLVAICLGLFSAATAACGFAQSFAQLVVMRMAVAIGEAGTTPASLSMLADRFPDRKGFASGALSAGAHLGLLAGVVLVSLLATRMGWRATFVITGLIGIAITIVYLLTVREPERLSTVERQPYGQALATLSRHASFRFATLTMVGLLFFNNATGAWMPAFLARAHHLSFDQIGLFIGLTAGLMGLVAVLAVGPLLDRLSRGDVRWMAWLPAIVITLMIASTFAGLMLDDTAPALLLLGIAPCIGLVAQTCIFAVLQTVIPAGLRASATAVLFLVANLAGMGLGPTLVGVLSSYFGTAHGLELRPALLVGILPGTIGIVACLFLARSLRADVVAVPGHLSSDD
ncbi:MFS transporter [Sphingomonas sp. So64.6b]|uniref:spinster family MFS transporter n=1 Tax=Sphingomonas sp. So64.6b TaxID=2997354 RepID=UPI00160423C5|nr:MFS transporter [Sphingomonas sp. So64.6b]QNA86319.1 MFS transporter [Sphingomonas sp. So64.6b]